MTSKNTLRLAILDDYQRVSLSLADWSSVKDRGVDISVFGDTLQATTERDKLIERLKPFDIICSMRERTKFNKYILGALPQLKLLTTTAMRNAAIDLPFAKEQGILVSGTGYAGEGTKEHNWMLLMAVARGVVRQHNETANSNPQWQTFIPIELKGKTLGVMGLGNLGKSTAKLGQAFGMDVQAWSPNLTAERAQEAGVKFIADKHEFFATSDIVSIHLVLSSETTNIVTKKELGAMKSSAFLINTSRGPLVNEADLIEALESQTIAGAGLDVYDVEPLPLDHKLRSVNNLTLTPHMGYVGDSMYKIFWKDTADNVAAFLDGKATNVMNDLKFEESRASKM